jgi:hypothetical protein
MRACSARLEEGGCLRGEGDMERCRWFICCQRRLPLGELRSASRGDWGGQLMLVSPVAMTFYQHSTWWTKEDQMECQRLTGLCWGLMDLHDGLVDVV